MTRRSREIILKISLSDKHKHATIRTQSNFTTFLKPLLTITSFSTFYSDCHHSTTSETSLVLWKSRCERNQIASLQTATFVKNARHATSHTGGTTYLQQKIMSSVRTRRQAAAVSSPATPSPAPREEQAVMNGNGRAHGSAKDDYRKENIFLFWPNLIGTFQQICSERKTVLTSFRLCSNHSCIRVPILHATSSKNLLRFVQRLLPSRCPRWVCCTIFRTIYKIWSCLGHGD
jgi:hypothetical protein